MSDLLENGMSKDTSTLEEVEEENINLMMDISRLCHHKDRQKVENILLIGMSGAGKSALVNTIIKVLAGRYLPRARVGKGNAASKTLTLTRYENCGVRYDDIDNGELQDIVAKMFKKLPTIIDMAGKGDNNSEEMQELLELFIRGCIPPGTSVKELEVLQNKHGVGELQKSIFTNPNSAWKVTKVVFVQGCHDAVPKNLIKCLHTVLEKTDSLTGKQLYTQDIFVVITKYDMVTDSPLRGESDKCHLSMEEFIAKENEIAEHFNIVGALAHNCIRWVSYSDNVGYDNPHIDNIALKFLKHMVTPGIVEQETPIHTKWMENIKRWMKDNNINGTALVIFILILVFAVLITFYLTKPVSQHDNNEHYSRRYN